MRRIGTALAIGIIAAAAAGARAQTLTEEASWPAGPNPMFLRTSTDGARLYASDATYGGSARIFETATGGVINEINLGTNFMPAEIARAPLSGLVAVAMRPQQVAVVDDAGGAASWWTIPVPVPRVRMTVSDDGTSVVIIPVSEGWSAWLYRRDAYTGALLSRIVVKEIFPITGLALTPEGKGAIVLANDPGTVTSRALIADFTTEKIVAQSYLPYWPSDVVFKTYDSWAYVASWMGRAVTAISPMNAAIMWKTPVPGWAFRVYRPEGSPYVWVLTDEPDELVALDPMTGAVIVRVPVPGVRAFRNDAAFSPDGNAAVVPGYDSHTVYLIDTNVTSQTFGSVLQSLYLSAALTAAEYAPDGGRVYVGDATNEMVRVLGVSGLKNLYEAILWATDQIKALLADPSIPQDAKGNLQKALDQLQGAHNGQATNGAVDKLQQGDLKGALVKIWQAIRELKKAATKGVPTETIQKVLAEGAMQDTWDFLVAKEEAGADLSAAWPLFQQGLDALAAGNYETAVKKFKDAVGAVT